MPIAGSRHASIPIPPEMTDKAPKILSSSPCAPARGGFTLHKSSALSIPQTVNLEIRQAASESNSIA